MDVQDAGTAAAVKHVAERKSSGSTSDWPMALMIDEVWLRTHRVLVHALESSGFWPESPRYRSFMQEQRRRGEQLKTALLLPLLSQNDAAHIGSESIFGASNRRFRSRLPFVLAFGSDLGLMLSRLLGPGNHTGECPKLCAIFNLGVSTFDLISDTDPLLFNQLNDLLDESRLRALAVDVGAAAQLAEGARVLSSPELRLLMTLIAEFFTRLNRLGQGAGSGSVRDVQARLLAFLVSAHRAEHQSTNAIGGDQATWTATSRAKSTLPFGIIGQIARLSNSGPIDDCTARSFDELMDAIGAIFWLTDDLVDIVRDFQEGSLNLLLAEAGRGPRATGRVARATPNDQAVLDCLLTGTAIETKTAALCAELARVDAILHAGALCTSDREPLLEFLTCYIRDWME